MRIGPLFVYFWELLFQYKKHCMVSQEAQIMHMVNPGGKSTEFKL
jgi:hypothetical protein